MSTGAYNCYLLSMFGDISSWARGNLKMYLIGLKHILAIHPMTTSSKILSTTYAPLISQVLLTVVPKLFCVDPTIQYYHYHLHPRLPSPWTKACEATGGVGPAVVGDGVKATSS